MDPAACPPAPPRGRPDLATVATLAAALGLSVFGVVFVHEVLGHGGMAELAGGRLLRIQVGIFHGHAWFKGVPPGGWRIAVGLGGIAVTLALGAAALGAARWVGSGSLAELLLRMLGAVSLASGFGYLGLGSMTGQGDPMAIDLPGGDLGRALVLGPAGLTAAGFSLLSQHRRLMALLGAPDPVRRRARIRFGMACWIPALVALVALELGLSQSIGTPGGAWLWVKLAAVPLAGVALPLADAFLPGARTAPPAAPPLGPATALALGAAYAVVVAMLASGLYQGWEV